MKVLVISHTYLAPINREKWRVCARDHTDVDLTVVFPRCWRDDLFTYDTDTIDAYERCRFVPLDAFGVGSEVTYGYYPRSFARIMRQVQPDVIHVEQGDNALCYLQAMFFAKLFVPQARCIFFTWINWIVPRTWRYQLFWSWVEWLNLRFSSGAIAGNADAKRILLAKKFRGEIKVLPQLGVDTRVFSPARIEDHVEKHVLFIGRVTAEKGVLLLARAFLNLAHLFPDWKLRFVGDGNARSDLMREVRGHPCAGQVSCVATVAHDDVAAHLNQASIVVLPSYDTKRWREQFGHVLVEAMSCGVAVMGSDAGEIANVIGDSGLIFEQKNEQDCREKLKLLMQDNQLRMRLATSGRRRVMRLYSHHAIAEQTYTFWQELVS